MTRRPTYEELEQQVQKLEKMAIEGKRAEKALREREALFRNVYDTAPLAFVVWDLETRVTDWNKRAEEVFGWSKKEALGHSFLDFLIPKKNRSEIENVVDRLFKGQLPSHSINDNLTKDGQIITCEWNNSPLHDDGGHIVGVISLALDITGRQQTEEALVKSEARYRAVVQDQTELICRFRPDGTLTFANDAYCRYFAKKPEELLGHKFMPLVPEENHKQIEKHLTSFSRENPVAEQEHRVIAPNGDIRWQKWTNRAIFDANGAIVEFQSVGRDVSERKKAEEALREKEAQLEAKADNLEEVNTALRVLLKRRDNDKEELETKVLSNVKDLILPYIERLKKTVLNDHQKMCVDILASNLVDIVSPFSSRLSSKYLGLTPTEIRVANLIKDDKTTKEIAEFMRLSEKTVETHRDHIRRKIGIKHKKVNLRTYLSTLQ
jgi:PAS domain S-box-containing protein